MNKPTIILKQYLIMPIIATEERIKEIEVEIQKNQSDVSLNGLFLMLVSYIESMKKEIIMYFLKYHPEKIDVRTIEVDLLILKESDDFDLMKILIVDYIEKMQYWKLKKLFYSALQIEKPSNHNEIGQIVKKRNELIHKNLEIDYKLGEVKKTTITAEYLKSSLDEYNSFITHLKSSISVSFNHYTKLNALKNLWHYTFKTSLCSDFTDYWHIDEKNDALGGCKYPKIAEDLSKIEKFMLQIWRSQVCGAKLEFPYMISIDRHFQKCFFMFLKLSKDIFLY